MNNDTTLFIGLDTHKSFTQVALLKNNRGETPITYGRINTSKSALIEGAHSYKHKTNISSELQIQQEGLSKEIIDIAWQVQLRLCRKH